MVLAVTSSVPRLLSMEGLKSPTVLRRAIEMTADRTQQRISAFHC
jgi:hypothetical protein